MHMQTDAQSVHSLGCVQTPYTEPEESTGANEGSNMTEN